MSKQVSELIVADIVKIVTSANKGILSRLDTLRDDIHGKVNDLETRVQLLENDNEKKDQEISKLKYTLVNIQRNLNQMDSEKSRCGVIITGLSEADIKISETSREVNLTTRLRKSYRNTSNNGM